MLQLPTVQDLEVTGSDDLLQSIDYSSCQSLRKLDICSDNSGFLFHAIGNVPSQDLRLVKLEFEELQQNDINRLLVVLDKMPAQRLKVELRASVILPLTE